MASNRPVVYGAQPTRGQWDMTRAMAGAAAEQPVKVTRVKVPPITGKARKRIMADSVGRPDTRTPRWYCSCCGRPVANRPPRTDVWVPGSSASAPKWTHTDDETAACGRATRAVVVPVTRSTGTAFRQA
jgi:hypothetical protein